ncbi:MAG: hypothetical protein WBN75_18640 [Verrucomicrobiia bacterium]
MTKTQKLVAAKAEARRAERAALDAKIRLAIVREKLDTHETAEAKQQRALVESAVKKLIATGAVHPGDHYGQFHVLEQLVKDPSLVTLALQKIYRARPAVNRR